MISKNLITSLFIMFALLFTATPYAFAKDKTGHKKSHAQVGKKKIVAKANRKNKRDVASVKKKNKRDVASMKKDKKKHKSKKKKKKLHS